MAEKTISLADQAYARIKENILNLTYPPGMTSVSYTHLDVYKRQSSNNI